jgi:tRNA(Ile)-lysidine synthase
VTGLDAPTPRPVARSVFQRLMRPLGPFEPKPELAVAVSGGADSLALLLLADRWAGARDGRVLALTVDHGIRPAAPLEAAALGRWLKPRAIRHVVLPWRGPKPGTGLAAAARAARYALLEDYCRRHGILHLLLAHQLEDQAETFLLRLGRASGMAGLAAMPALMEHADVRLLRPLLTVPRARLEATLADFGQPWVDDPSNRDHAQTRPRLRAALPDLGRAGVGPAVLVAAAAKLAAGREAQELQVASLLARALACHPAGHGWLDPAPVLAADPEVARAALSAALLYFGGQAHAPRGARLERLYMAIAQGLAAARTLGGCRLAASRGRILIVPEVRAIGADRPAGGRARPQARLGYRRGGPGLASLLGKAAGSAAVRSERRFIRALTAPTFMLAKGAAATI